MPREISGYQKLKNKYEEILKDIRTLLGPTTPEERQAIENKYSSSEQPEITPDAKAD